MSLIGSIFNFLYTGLMMSKNSKCYERATAHIPDSCTGYVQPIDTILNKLVKDKIVDILKKLLVVVEETDDSVGHRRILITLVVAQAWL